MPLPVCPDDTWGKSEYWEDVKWYQHSIAVANQMPLTQKQRGCCNNITETITESISILNSSGKRLNKTEKQRLYELAVLRSRNFASFFKKE